jgi:hypothetical protein
LGRNCRPLRTCQHPLHTGKRVPPKNRNVINLETSKAIHLIFVSQPQLDQVWNLKKFLRNLCFYPKIFYIMYSVFLCCSSHFMK